MTPWFPWATDRSRSSYRKWLATDGEQWEDDVWHYSIRYRGRMVGSMSAWRIRDRAAEFGYWLDERVEGRGFASEALTVVMDELTECGYREFEIHCEPHNFASAQVAVRNGFQRVRSYRGKYGYPKETRFIVYRKRIG